VVRLSFAVGQILICAVCHSHTNPTQADLLDPGNFNNTPSLKKLLDKIIPHIAGDRNNLIIASSRPYDEPAALALVPWNPWRKTADRMTSLLDQVGRVFCECGALFPKLS
jgi:hypothetical protein